MIGGGTVLTPELNIATNSTITITHHTHASLYFRLKFEDECVGAGTDSAARNCVQFHYYCFVHVGYPLFLNELTTIWRHWRMLSCECLANLFLIYQILHSPMSPNSRQLGVIPLSVIKCSHLASTPCTPCIYLIS